MSVQATWLPSDDWSVTRRHIDELRGAVRRDVRFGWVMLGDSSSLPRILTRLSSSTISVDSSRRTHDVEVEAETLPQHVWPAAPRMYEWMMAHSSFFHGKSVLELGAGTGYVGFAVSKMAARVVLTDTSLMSLALMEETLATGAFANCSCARLQWGRLDHLTALKQHCRMEVFDVVIGSDIFYFDHTLTLGLLTARAALLPGRDGDAAGSFLCGSVARSSRMETDLQRRPAEYGFSTRLLIDDGAFQLYEWTISTSCK